MADRTIRQVDAASVSASVEYSSVPPALRDRKQWLCWRLEGKPGAKKPAKMPYYASGKRRTGQQGSTADRAALVTFDAAVAAMASINATGIGFAFLPGDGLIGIDLDKMVDVETGELAPRAQRIIEACGSYTEWSPSGSGFHIYVIGETETSKDNGIGVEMFCGRQFFTVTGRHLAGTPTEVAAIDPKVLRRLQKTIEAAKGGFSDKPTLAPKAAQPATASQASDRDRIHSALVSIDPGIGYDDWLQIGMALHSALGTEGFRLWDEWSARSDKYPGQNVLSSHWKSFKPGGVQIGTLFHLAKHSGWKPARTAPAKAPPAGGGGPKAPPGTGRAVTGFDATDRRFIRHDAGRLPEVLDAIETALQEDRSNQLFVHSGRLARVYLAGDTNVGIVRRPKGALILHQVDASLAAELATAAAMHLKFDSRSGDDKRIDCPRRAAESILSRGYWPGIPKLEGIAEGPFILPDTRVIDQPGYDAGSQIFMAGCRISGYSRPPSKPALGDAERAVAALHAAVETFPFVSEHDRTAALAGIITGLICRVLPARPMFPITAPTPGTGKSLLADTMAIVAIERQASVLSLGHDDAEAEKRLGGVLLAGDQVVNIDNVERPLGGDLLCQMTTQPSLRLRPLGTSGMLSVPTNALLIATGNNLQIKGDLKRRVCLIRLDARSERPEHRKFARNHIEYVSANRGRLIHAALTIPLAYLAAGAPEVDIHPMGGFELWDRMVRRPLVWLGLPDPLATSEGLRDSDPDLENLRQFLFECAAIYKRESFTAADVLADALETIRDAGGKSTGVPIRPSLRDAVRAVCRDKPGSSQLGYWLRAHRDRIVDGMFIERSSDDGHAKVARWRVVSTAGDAGTCG
ncbi:MAG: PriCT-2 domain-containing protein [Sulfuritalea sp.]|nr:PriCT-2 domain-containing protein [Sulfuritalea sp.]